MVKTQGAKLNAVKFGVAAGIMGAIFILVMSLMAVANQGLLWVALIMNAYGGLGYNITFFGTILGMIYSFIDCFIVAWIFALIYNKLI
jgi:hypothetical protein